jgi:hypothetical protein
MPDFEHFVPGVTAALAVGIALKSKETTSRIEIPKRLIN